jgi:hypothetical protein
VRLTGVPAKHRQSRSQGRRERATGKTSRGTSTRLPGWEGLPRSGNGKNWGIMAHAASRQPSHVGRIQVAIQRATDRVLGVLYS